MCMMHSSVFLRSPEISQFVLPFCAIVSIEQSSFAAVFLCSDTVSGAGGGGSEGREEVKIPMH